MKNIGARPVLAPSVMDTSISCSISSKLMGPCRLWPVRLRPIVTGIEPLLDELPSEGSGAELLVLARLPVMIGPKISFAILKYGALLFPVDIWNGPTEKSLKTPRMYCDSSWSPSF